MVGIVILNYKNWQVTVNCIESIMEYPPNEDYQIVIVDNGSRNESVEELKRRFEGKDYITILPLPENVGFAAGNNRGIEVLERMGISECVLSNSDILVSNGSIDKLAADVRKENVVVVGPKILRGGYTQHSSRLEKGRLIDPLEIGRFFPVKKLDEDNEIGLHEVFSVSGCCFAIDIEKFRSMGAFDEGTFLYNEENILGMQAEKDGLRILIDLDVFVVHEHGASSGVENDFVRTEYIKSTLYYWRRYRGKGRMVLSIILNVFIMKLRLQHNPGIHPDEIKASGKEYLDQLMQE